MAELAHGHEAGWCWLAAASCVAALLAAPNGAACPSPAGHGPASLVHTVTAARGVALTDGRSTHRLTHFWRGTDTGVSPVTGPSPYREPVINGAYGGYLGMVGSWQAWMRCGKSVWSDTNSQQANNNYIRHHEGIGTAAYWFMAGPGIDPNYNGTAWEARDWGARQAAQALRDISRVLVTYPVVFADVEMPGSGPAPDNGWRHAYTSACSGRMGQTRISRRLDRADLNGFLAYLTTHSFFLPGIYSSQGLWAGVFGTGPEAHLTNVYEWTYMQERGALIYPPVGWCLRGTSICAQFFGGVSRASPQALIWQWSGGGGTFNGYGDFDQIDARRTPEISDRVCPAAIITLVTAAACPIGIDVAQRAAAADSAERGGFTNRNLIETGKLAA